MKLEEFLKELFQGTNLVPVKNKNFIEIYLVQKDGEKIPAGYKLDGEENFIVDFSYSKDEAIITEEFVEPRDVEEHIEKEFKELLVESMRNRGYDLEENMWLSSDEEDMDIYILRFKKTIKAEEVLKEIEEIEKLKEKLEVF